MVVGGLLFLGSHWLNVAHHFRIIKVALKINKTNLPSNVDNQSSLQKLTNLPPNIDKVAHNQMA